MSALAADLDTVAQFAQLGVPPRYALRILAAWQRTSAELVPLLDATEDQVERDRLVLKARSIYRARVSAVIREMRRVRN